MVKTPTWMTIAFYHLAFELIRGTCVVSVGCLAGTLTCLTCNENAAKVADNSCNECSKLLCYDDFDEDYWPGYLKDDCWSIKSSPCRVWRNLFMTRQTTQFPTKKTTNICAMRFGAGCPDSQPEISIIYPFREENVLRQT